MAHTARIDTHLGVPFKVEAIARGDGFEGRYTILDGNQVGKSGADDSLRPALDRTWAYEEEALTYATEAAHHAIEGVRPFNKGDADGLTPVR